MKPMDIGNEIIKKQLKNIYSNDPPLRNLSLGFKRSLQPYINNEFVNDKLGRGLERNTETENMINFVSKKLKNFSK